jgi:2-iminobutanoate/2-iminopropanoate deaminase
MSRQIIFTLKAAKPPVTYSQAGKVAGLIFVSGTAPHDPQTGALVGATIQEQTRQCLKNIAAIFGIRWQLAR